MLLDPTSINALLGALGLTTGLFKPLPDLVDGILAPVNGILNGVASAADGILQPLGLSGLVDALLEADPTASASMTSATAAPGSLLVGNIQSLANSNISCTVEPYDAPVLQQGFPVFNGAEANIYRYRQQQSVNLGSW